MIISIYFSIDLNFVVLLLTSNFGMKWDLLMFRFLLLFMFLSNRRGWRYYARWFLLSIFKIISVKLSVYIYFFREEDDKDYWRRYSLWYFCVIVILFLKLIPLLKNCLFIFLFCLYFYSFNNCINFFLSSFYYIIKSLAFSFSNLTF